MVLDEGITEEVEAFPRGVVMVEEDAPRVVEEESTKGELGTMDNSGRKVTPLFGVGATRGVMDEDEVTGGRSGESSGSLPPIDRDREFFPPLL